MNDHRTSGDHDSRYARLAGGSTANFTAMPQVGGDPIVESGSNSDGEWTRWADGTQLCGATSSTSFSTTNALGSVFYNNGQAMVFPKPFTSVVTVSPISGPASPGRVSISGYYYGLSLTGVSIGGFGADTVRDFVPAYITVGRWK
jgi:hypothetical protein